MVPSTQVLLHEDPTNYNMMTPHQLHLAASWHVFESKCTLLVGRTGIFRIVHCQLHLAHGMSKTLMVVFSHSLNVVVPYNNPR